MGFGMKGLSAGTIIAIVIGLVVLLTVVSSVAPTLDNSANLLSNTTDVSGNALPFSSLFASGGLIMLGFMAVILLGVFGMLGLTRR